MRKNKFALQIVALSLIILSFIACDKDFATLESDIITDENATNFDIYSNPQDIITYTNALGPVQTNGFGLNSLGIYDDSYGRTTSSFVTQVIPSSYNPSFGDEVEIDSVVLTIPYQFTVTEIDEDGQITYDIDSVLPKGETYKPIKLSLFESNYLIRDFDPNGDFDDSQAYFSNKSASETELISNATLEGTELTMLSDPETSHLGNNIINVSEEGYILTDVNDVADDGNATLIQRQPPGIRVKLEPEYWQNKIIVVEEETVFDGANNFGDYFRGIYFKAEANNENEGSYLILNTSAASSNITIYYTRLTPSTTDDPDERENASFVLNFSANSINFLNNDFTTPITNGDPVAGDSRIYLKGGEGSIGRIKLFNGDNINDGDDNTFDNWKSLYVETDSEGNFERSKRLVNEANLVFYVDQAIVQDGEPERIYVYDMDNKTPLVDYFLDNINNNIPSFSIFSHLGPLQRVNDEPDGNGIKYKLRITEHINNLLLRDSTNVELGLSVSLNVNLEESLPQRMVQNLEDSDFTVPTSSVVSPRGTILHGNNTENESKKVYLEIYYTEPN